MKFLINKLLFKDDDPVPLPKGMDVVIFDGKIPKPKSSEKQFLFGAIEDISKLSTYEHTAAEQVIETIFDEFNVASYLEQLGHDGLNYEDSYFKLACQLSTNDISSFIRSDSGRKLLTGQVLDNTLLGQIRQRTHPYIAPDDLLFLAPRQNIFREFRLWVLDDKIVGFSEYTWDDNKDLKEVIPTAVFTFARKVINRYSPAIGYVMDIAEMDDTDEFKVIEYNGFSTSGLYDVDLEKLLKAVEAYYKEEHAKV